MIMIIADAACFWNIPSYSNGTNYFWGIYDVFIWGGGGNHKYWEACLRLLSIIVWRRCGVGGERGESSVVRVYLHTYICTSDIIINETLTQKCLFQNFV